jgi:D-3-phosphoglycerate dehydrogenase
VLAEALGMQVIFHDVETKLALGNAQPASLDDLLARRTWSPCTCRKPRPRRMIGASSWRRQARRAPDQRLARHRGRHRGAGCGAASGHVAGAALDVFPVEPKGNGDIFESPLRHDNVILTPHVGGSTLEAQDNIGVEVAAKLVRYSDNGSTLSAVNFPEVTLPEHEDSRRCCTSTATCRACCRASTRSSRATTSTSTASSCAPTPSWATWSSTSPPARPRPRLRAAMAASRARCAPALY